MNSVYYLIGFQVAKMFESMQLVYAVFKQASGWRGVQRCYRGLHGRFRKSQRISLAPQRVRKSFRGFSVAYQKVSVDFQGVSDALQGRFCGLRRVSGYRGPMDFKGFRRMRVKRRNSGVWRVQEGLRLRGSEGFSGRFQDKHSEKFQRISESLQMRFLRFPEFSYALQGTRGEFWSQFRVPEGLKSVAWF